MGIPASQAMTVSSYLLKQKVKRNKRYPLVLMLEPLWRCNLACVGCGKIQHSEEILGTYLSPAECWEAVEECGAPVVSIAGGEPLVHPQIDKIVAGMIERKKYVYLCTNAILLAPLAAQAHAFKVPLNQRAHGRHARNPRPLRRP